FEAPTNLAEATGGTVGCNATPPVRRGLTHADAVRPLYPHKNVYFAVLVSMFLHASWFHVLGNLLFLWIFGNNVEERLGSVAYAVFYVA
ncbi:rhomboid family intramembrane serine protease, partial [Klebsiella pneumoniae]|nr:rhomboid family intramembrane serine protease [Klebsiella pneumoniae]